jgi:hypothetical protein
MVVGRSEGSSVSIVVSHYKPHKLGDQGSIPGKGKRIFPSSLCVQTGSGAHPASKPMGTRWGEG